MSHQLYKRPSWCRDCWNQIRTVPDVIRSPIHSSFFSDSTKQQMIKGSLKNSLGSVCRVCFGVPESIDDLADKWLDWDKVSISPSQKRQRRILQVLIFSQEPGTVNQIRRWKESGQKDHLEAALRNRIQFGTAGLRGVMKAGFANINSLIIIQTSQGLAQYLLDQQPDARIKGVVIGHDTRENSARYAKLAAGAFHAKGIKIHWFEEYVPTPYVAFAVRYLNAAAGVMITASHNPKDDNGYKVYWSNGAQINTPHDIGISQCILANQEPWPYAWDSYAEFLTSRSSPDRVRQVDMKIDLEYTHAVSEYAIMTAPRLRLVRLKNVIQPFIYTPLHGVGYKSFKKIAQIIGILEPMIVVPEQAEPDKAFPTIEFPNPEEEMAFNLAIKTAEANGRHLIIMNDPDADRFAVAERFEGRWHKFTGDQIGVLLASYLQPKIPSETACMLNTAVSSSMLNEIPGFRKKETLTGFKWLGNKAHELEAHNVETILGYEEALGYMFPRISYDKDGLAAAAVFLIASAEWWLQQRITPFTKLQQLYQQYGYFETLNLSFRSKPEDLGAISRTFRNLRAKIYPYVDGKPNLVRLGAHEIYGFRDLTRGDVWSRDPQAPFVQGLPTSKDVEMITFWAEWRKNPVEKSRFTLRSSGTEPKLKLYLECRAQTQGRANFLVRDMLECIVNEILRRNGPLTDGWEDKMLSSSSGNEFPFPPERLENDE